MQRATPGGINIGQEFADWLAGNERWAVELKGLSPIGPLIRGERTRVKELRDVLRPSNVPIIRCIGLNYMKHSKSILRGQLNQFSS